MPKTTDTQRPELDDALEDIMGYANEIATAAQGLPL